MIVPIETDDAAQEPVRRVQRVRVMRSDHVQTGTAHEREELTAAVDANVSAFDRVIRVGHHPVCALGAGSRNRDRDETAGTDDPCHLAQRLDVINEMLEDFGSEHPIERRWSERKARHVGDNFAMSDRAVDFSRFLHGARHLRHLGDFRAIAVESDDVRAADEGGEAVTAGSATEVEHTRALFDRGFVEIDRQHVRSAMTSRYCSTVSAATRLQE